MKLENQVCTLEQAKRFIQLGISRPSVFVYFKADNHSGIVLGGMYMRHIWIVTGVAYEEQDVNITPAYTVSELGDMLPSESGMICWDVTYNDHLGIWNCRIYDLVKWLEQDPRPEVPPVAYESEGDTMAEAMADTLFHCIENKLVSIDYHTSH